MPAYASNKIWPSICDFALTPLSLSTKVHDKLSLSTKIWWYWLITASSDLQKSQWFWINFKKLILNVQGWLVQKDLYEKCSYYIWKIFIWIICDKKHSPKWKYLLTYLRFLWPKSPTKFTQLCYMYTYSAAPSGGFVFITNQSETQSPPQNKIKTNIKNDDFDFQSEY